MPKFRYALSREVDGEFRPTDETFDIKADSMDTAGPLALDRVLKQQAEHGGCWAATLMDDAR